MGRSNVFLVPVNGSPASLAALQVARNLAPVMGAMLHLVHAAEQPLSQRELLRRLHLSKTDLRGAVLDCLVGPPRQVICAAADRSRAQLIVMGASPGFGDYPRAPGELAESVICATRLPVVLVLPQAGGRLAARGGRLTRLLLPLDGAPRSAETIAPALLLAARSGANVDILHVAGRGIEPPTERGTYTVPRFIDQPQHAWPTWTQEFTQRFLNVAGPFVASVPVRLSLSIDGPARAILEFAREHETDLIALEWRGELDPQYTGTPPAVLAPAPFPVLLICGQPPAG